MIRQRLGKLFLSIAVFIFCLPVTYRFVQRGALKDTVKYVCDLVAERYYESSSSLVEWHRSCLQIENDVGTFVSKKFIVNKLQSQLLELGVSHLYLNEPEEDLRMWKGTAKENGLVLKVIEGHYIISEILKGSPAEDSGFLMGDEILFIGKDRPVDPLEIRTSRGPFQVQRRGSTLELSTNIDFVKIDDEPKLKEVSKNIGLLKISSFRSEFFSEESWRLNVEKLSQYNNIIVDLRGNLGGNFVAMLRALSPFICDGQKIGQIVRPRILASTEDEQRPGVSLPDLLQDRVHYDIVNETGLLSLKSFTHYECFEGDLAVLVDYSTASVSEIFAAAIRDLRRGRVYGEQTAGRVVLAVWYNVPFLGRGYSLSIPEAIFKSLKGQSYEGRGLVPDQILSYSLSREKLGVDSWVEQVRFNK